MIVDVAIVALKAFLVLFMVLNLAGVLGWVERKGSALIQDRIGANRASIFGFAGMGLVNTLLADPLKFLTKEDFIPPAGDKLLHTLAPCMALFPALVTFAVIPFGDVLIIGDRILGMRRKNKLDWRTNLSRGATAESFAADDSLIDIACRAADAVHAPLAGVDLLPGKDGRLYTIEVNAVPGWKGLAKALSLDVARLVLDFVTAEVCRRRERGRESFSVDRLP